MTGALRGKVALVTGGSGGIGAATVRAFAREGAAGVGIHYTRSRERAEELAAAVAREGTEAVPLQADLAEREEARRLVERTVEAFGALHVLVCYAGHPFRRDEWFAPFEDLTEAQLLSPLRVDLLGSVYCLQAAVPHLKEAGGRIILVSSTPALRGDVEGFSYLLAKGGILSLTKALARYLGPEGVHVNCLALGSIGTEAMGDLSEEEEQALAEETALLRVGQPEEVARKAVFLASDDASFLTGATLVVDGGYAYL